MAPTPELGAKSHADTQTVLAALRPWVARQTYMNFVERREDARRFVSETAYHRLRRIKHAVDPGNVIRSTIRWRRRHERRTRAGTCFPPAARRAAEREFERPGPRERPRCTGDPARSNRLVLGAGF